MIFARTGDRALRIWYRLRVRDVTISVESSEFALAVDAAKGLNLTLEDFAKRCVLQLAKAEPAKAGKLTPSALQNPSWAEAIAIAKKRAGKK